VIEIKEKYKCHNVTVYESKCGDIRIAHYAIAFGEPEGTIKIRLSEPNGTFETRRAMKPDEAIEFGKELIRRAKLVKKSMRLWKQKGIKAHIVWAEEAVKLKYYKI